MNQDADGMPPLDPETWAAYAKKAKQALRKRMKAVRGGYSADSLALRSRAIVERLLLHPELSEAGSVALFWPMLERGEVDLRPLDAELRSRGVRLYYPFMEALDKGEFLTGFRASSRAADLVDRGRGFLEPPAGPAATAGEIEWVVVPALAADPRGHRIGYGAGYYDATLSDVCPPGRSVIVAYQFQILAELPVEAHDRSCDWVISDEQTYGPAETLNPDH